MEQLIQRLAWSLTSHLETQGMHLRGVSHDLRGIILNLSVIHRVSGRLGRAILSALAGVLCFGVTQSATAQITPDRTLPTNSEVTTTGNTRTITGGTVRGANLFHSFGQFSVPTGGEAYFNNGLAIQNILTRVTGNSISNIDGLIRANGTANLFFLNPNGIVFGPNARLQIGGSFLATTASSFKFPDGSEFSATNPQAPPLLTVKVPLGLQYGKAVGDIQQTGSLAVPEGQSLTLHGNTVTTTGTLVAPRGTVQLLGDRVALLDKAQIDVSSPTGGGTVLIGGDYKGQGSVPNALQTYVAPAATINADAMSTGNGGKVIVWSDGTTRFYGNISARGGAQAGNGGVVEVSGAQSLTFNGLINTSAPAGVTGTLLLDPINITVVSGNTPNPPNASDGIWEATEDPGDQTIGANAIVSLLNTNALTLEATDKITFTPNANVIINSANTLMLHARSLNFSSMSLTQIGSGDIVLDTTQNRDTPAQTTQDTAVFANNSIIGTALLGTAPQGGNFRVITGSLTAINGSNFGAVTFGTGNAGNVTLAVSGSVTLDGTGPLLKVQASLLAQKDLSYFDVIHTPSAVTSYVGPGATGNSGNLELTADSLTVTNGAYIFVSTFGAGNAGSLKVTVNGAVNFDAGTAPNGGGAFIGSTVERSANGKSGNVELTAGSLTVINGAQLTANTFGAGSAGNLKVRVNSAAIFDGTSRNGQIASGVTSQVLLGANGKGGNIELIADSLTIRNGAQLTANTFGTGNAGTINVNVKDQLILTGNGTGIFASTAPGSTGNGGNVIIDPQRVLIQDGAAISVNSQGIGIGGNVFLQADLLELRDFGSITAETASAQGGNITLDVKDLVLMRHNSLISATAGTAQSRGDGGNITIRAPFIVGVLSENSDITANAFTGRGGNITITTDGIYGIQFQNFDTPFSDITASSRFGVSGTVILNILNINPVNSLSTLPTNFDDQSSRIQPGCITGKQGKAGQFVSVGRGGLPTDPTDPLTTDSLLTAEGQAVDPIDPVATRTTPSPPSSASRNATAQALVEANGWLMQPDGTVALTAGMATTGEYKSTGEYRPFIQPVSCDDLLQPSH